MPKAKASKRKVASKKVTKNAAKQQNNPEIARLELMISLTERAIRNPGMDSLLVDQAIRLKAQLKDLKKNQ